MGRKQKAYIEILRHALLFIRYGVTLFNDLPFLEKIGFIVRKEMAPFAAVAELIHGVPPRLLNEEFDNDDLWFLNVHARTFYNQSRAKGSPTFGLLMTAIQELFSLVPEDLQNKLEWAGPNVPPISETEGHSLV